MHSGHAARKQKILRLLQNTWVTRNVAVTQSVYRESYSPESGLSSLDNFFIVNNMAERVGFEFTRKRSFNNIERTAGTVKAMEDSGKQC